MVKIFLVFVVTVMFWAAGHIVFNTLDFANEDALMAITCAAIFGIVITGAIAGSPLYAVMALLNMILGLGTAWLASKYHSMLLVSIIPGLLALVIAFLAAVQMKYDIDEDDIPVCYP